MAAASHDDVRLNYARPEWLSESPARARAPQQQKQQATPTRSSTPARVSIPQRALGVDYGTVWTGLATAELGRATPLRVVRNDPDRAAFSRSIVQAALQHGAGGIVVGIPLRTGQGAGDPRDDTPHAAKCRSFAESLSIVAGGQGLDVFLYDEARTTSFAMMQANVSGTERLGNIGRKSKNEKQIDAWSAAMLLNRFYQQPGSAVRVKLRAIVRSNPEQQQEAGPQKPRQQQRSRSQQQQQELSPQQQPPQQPQQILRPPPPRLPMQ